MLSFVLLFLLRRIGGVALPIIGGGLPPSAHTIDAGLEDQRTIFTIVSGCLSTTFICAWVSVHPNIPPPKSEEYGWRSLARRMRLLFWALVVPELILSWSFRQWVAAGKIAKIYNERNNSAHTATSKSSFFVTLGKRSKDWFRGRLDEEEESTACQWTRTHGHFVAMGGVILLAPVEEAANRHDRSESTQRKPTETIVDIKLLEELVKDPNFTINITEEEINDKSKGDFLSKTLAFLQVSWFITQCIVRFVEGLGVTQLEVVTLALASMNGMMYFFWSSKPLGLRVPIRIRSARKVDVTPNWVNLGRELRKKMRIPNFHPLGRIEDASTAICLNFLCCLLSPLHLLLAVGYLLVLFIAAIAEVVMTDTIPRNATHVPAFYSPYFYYSVDDHRAFTVTLSIFGSISASIFGGLHCLAWNFTYPAQMERSIWRVASLTVTLAPPVFAILGLLLNNFTLDVTGRKKRWVVMTVFVIAFIPASIFVSARVVLLVEAFALLRCQPANVFQDVSWTKYLPHV